MADDPTYLTREEVIALMQEHRWNFTKDDAIELIKEHKWDVTLEDVIQLMEERHINWLSDTDAAMEENYKAERPVDLVTKSDFEALFKRKHQFPQDKS